MTVNADNKLFFGSLTASLFIHAAMIGLLSLAASTVKIRVQPPRPIEVTYEVAKKEQKKEVNSSSRTVQALKSDELPSESPDVKVLSRKYEVPPPLQDSFQEMEKSTGEVTFSREKTPPSKALAGERKITVPMLQSEKITNPQYLSYTQNIRQRIKQRAYYYADYPDFQSGDVYLTFVLSSTGVLQGVKVISEKTHASAYLQEIGVRSIEESAPFPPFPEDLRYPELTFNVIISFELTE